MYSSSYSFRKLFGKLLLGDLAALLIRKLCRMLLHKYSLEFNLIIQGRWKGAHLTSLWLVLKQYLFILKLPLFHYMLISPIWKCYENLISNSLFTAVHQTCTYIRHHTHTSVNQWHTKWRDFHILSHLWQGKLICSLVLHLPTLIEKVGLKNNTWNG